MKNAQFCVEWNEWKIFSKWVPLLLFFPGTVASFEIVDVHYDYDKIIQNVADRRLTMSVRKHSQSRRHSEIGIARWQVSVLNNKRNHIRLLFKQSVIERWLIDSFVDCDIHSFDRTVQADTYVVMHTQQTNKPTHMHGTNTAYYWSFHALHKILHSD